MTTHRAFVPCHLCQLPEFLFSWNPAVIINPAVPEGPRMFELFSPGPQFIGISCPYCYFQVVAPVASSYSRLFASIVKNHHLHCRYSSLPELETKVTPQPALIRDGLHGRTRAVA
jgi:hypothetical protein